MNPALRFFSVFLALPAMAAAQPEPAPPPPPASASASAAYPMRAETIEGTVDTSFQLMHPPEYPGEALANGVEGATVLLVVVDADGFPVVIDVEKTSGSKPLDSASVQAARQWRFNAPRRLGVPVSGVVRVPVDFQLSDKPVHPAGGRPNWAGAIVWTDPARMARMLQGATQGDPDAQFTLGVVCMNGAGVEQDDVLAQAWLTVASRQSGNPRIAELLVTLAGRMSREQIDEALDLAQAWKAGQPMRRRGAAR